MDYKAAEAYLIATAKAEGKAEGKIEGKAEGKAEPFHFYHSQQATYVIRVLVDPA